MSDMPKAPQKNKWIKPVAFIAIGLGIGILATFTNQKPPSPQSSTYAFEDFSKSISSDAMVKTINVLAPADDARITGFKGEQQAAQYIADQMKQIGLEVATKDFPVEAYQNISLSITPIDKVIPPIKDATALNFSGATPKEGVTGELVDVGMGAETDFAKVDVKGKLPLIQRGGEYFRIKVARAAEKGAIGAVFYDPNNENAISATLGTLSDIPAVCLSRSSALELATAIQQGKKPKLNLVIDSVSQGSHSSNVIGTLKASSNPSGKMLVIGAHYDGVNTPAANDNASGVAVLLEMAKQLAAKKDQLKCDIQFMAFGAEEIGLIGSSQYVNALNSTERSNIIAMLNFDMVGNGDGLCLYTDDMYTNTSLLKLSGQAATALKYTNTHDVTTASDHAPFAESGIPAIMFETTPAENYHTDLDTKENIAPSALVLSCNTGLNIALEIAKNPSVIQR